MYWPYEEQYGIIASMKFFTRKRKRIYLDYAAATPVRQRVLNCMQRFYREDFANASAIHAEGVIARNAIDVARAKLGNILKTRTEHVYFTGSGTESNNLALLGVVESKRQEGLEYADMEIIASPIEHPSVANTLAYVESKGVTVHYLTVDGGGVVVTDSLQQQLSEKTILVSFAYVNSEIGVVQDVGKLARIVRAFAKKHATCVYIHVDGAQAPLWLPCQMDRLLVDMLTLDAGKCYGPKGVGVLVLRHGVKIASVLHGGPQENGLRPATENVAGIVGAAEAVTVAQEQYASRAQQVTRIREYMINALLDIEGVILNGSRTERVANNVNISIPGIDSEFAVVMLNEQGIACSTKSACSGVFGGGSSVVQAISGDIKRATSSIRFTFGEDTSRIDIDRVVTILKMHIHKTRTQNLG